MDKFVPTGVSNPLYQIDGSKDVFDGLEKSGLSMNSGFVQSSISRYMLTSNIIQYHHPEITPTVLDFGCGAASFKSFWDTNFQIKDKKTLDYTGLEITPSYIGAGIAKGHVIRHFDANNQDIRTLDLPSNADIILMQQFIEHINVDALDYLLDFTKDILNQDGLLIVSAPDPKSGTKILEHHHDYEYTLEEITEKLRQHGFRVARQYGWLGYGIPNFEVLSEIEKEIYNKLRFISDGYANSVMCMINTRFAPYYYLVLEHDR